MNPRDFPMPNRWFYSSGAVWAEHPSGGEVYRPGGVLVRAECVATRASAALWSPTDKDRALRLAAASPRLLAAIEDLLQSLAELGCYPGSDEDVSGADVVELLHQHFPELNAVVEEAGGEVPK